MSGDHGKYQGSLPNGVQEKLTKAWGAKMNIKQATKILKAHNEWRRSNEDYPIMGDVTELGIAIDTIVKLLENEDE